MAPLFAVRFATPFRLLSGSLLVFILGACTQKDRIHRVVISVPDQRMVVYKRGVELARYDVSTSKFGLGDRPGSNATPLGHLEVAKKIGGGAPLGMKFKSRRPTGEIVPVDAPGRDPIVTRILWLKGTEASNRNAYRRTIYIHGTAEECKIGAPASYGCIRMRSREVRDLYSIIGEGAGIDITTTHLPPTPETFAAQTTIVPPTVAPGG